MIPKGTKKVKTPPNIAPPIREKEVIISKLGILINSTIKSRPIMPKKIRRKATKIFVFCIRIKTFLKVRRNFKSPFNFIAFFYCFFVSCYLSQFIINKVLPIFAFGPVFYCTNSFNKYSHPFIKS